MKIVKNNTEGVAHQLAKTANDQTFETIMQHLDQVESLSHAIDPTQYPEYYKRIYNKLDGLTHAIGGVLQTQEPPLNPNQLAPQESGLTE